jgi:hypothetical protein
LGTGLGRAFNLELGSGWASGKYYAGLGHAESSRFGLVVMLVGGVEKRGEELDTA